VRVSRPQREKVDAIVHAATSPSRRAKSTEVEGTRNIRDAAVAAGAPHLLYVSIVGVDRFSVPYYKAKRAAELVVEQMEGAWTVQRITQFHDLVDRFFGLGAFPRTRSLSFQPKCRRRIVGDMGSRQCAGSWEPPGADQHGDESGRGGRFRPMSGMPPMRWAEPPVTSAGGHPAQIDASRCADTRPASVAAPRAMTQALAFDRSS
jgi:hypothetical protein